MSRRDQTTIGVLVAFTRGLYFGGVLRGIDQAARAAGARVIVIQTQVPWLDQGDRERVRRFFPFAWDHLDGYIVLTEAIDLAGIEAIIRAGKPVVTISAVYPELACTAVVPDNVGGTCSAVDHLVGHGHRRIGFVGSLEQQDLRERYAGYQQALRTHGIEPDPDLLYLAEHNGERGALQAARQIVADRRCTAVVVGTDLCALDVIETAQACGMHVPGDLAVIGFDDIYEAQHTDPALTSVRCRFDDLGATAAGLLLGQIAGQPARSEPSYVPATLVQRFSCGCLEPATVAITTGDQGLAAQDWELHLAERLAAQLLYPAVLPPTLQPSSVWPGVGRLVEGLRAAVEDRPPPTAPEIAASWQAAGERATTVEALNAVYLLLSHAAQVRLALGGDNQAAERVRLYLLGCHLELIRACRLSSVLRCRALEAVVQINYEIGRALNRPSIGTTRDLSWLRSSSVVRGCLARWGEPTGGEAWPALTVRGCYSTAETPRVALGSSWTTEAFPPPEFVRASTDLVAPGPTVLLPLRTSAGDWGVLATVRPAADQVAAADSRGGPEEWAALLTPVLEREDLLGSLAQQREMLRESEERYALAAGGVDDGLWDWNLLTSEVFYSSRWQTMLGFGEHGLGSTPEEWFSRVHTEDAAGLKAAVEAHIAGVTNVLESEYRIARRDGTYVWMRCRGVAVRGANGVAVRMAGSQADVSERKAAEERLRHSALHDGLTGLPNRECFMAGLGEMLARSEQPGALPFAVFFLDIDGFKHVNDRLGHSVGDRLLIAFAQRLQSCLRCSDLLARLGGDEFAILVDPIDGATMAHQIGERIQRSIMAAFDIDGHRIYTSTSIGAVLNASPGHTADELLRNADFAMYAVKAHGGAGYQQYSERLETLHHGHAYDQPRVRRTRRSRSASQTDAPAKPESLG